MCSTRFVVALCLTQAVSCIAKDAGEPAKDAPYADVAQQFFPDSLKTGVDLAAIGLKPGKLQSAFVATDFSGGSDTNEGRKFLVVAYSNSWQGNIRVLRRNADAWSMATEVPVPQVVNSPSITLRDLDGDATPEVIIQYGVSPGISRSTWIFRWTGTGLQSLWDATGEDGGGMDVADFVDLDADGKLEAIVRSTECETRQEDGDAATVTTAVFSAYRLANNVYDLCKDLVAYAVFAPRKDGTDAPVESSFEAADTHAHYLMRIVHSGKAWIIRSAEIQLNGAVVVDPSAFKHKTPITFP